LLIPISLEGGKGGRTKAMGKWSVISLNLLLAQKEVYKKLK
jgi:hypothetical protein